MSQFSDEVGAVAIELLTEFGQQGDFERVAQGAYDPTNGDFFSETTTDFSGYILPVGYAESEVDGTVIQRDDTRILAHKMDEVPHTDDVLTFSGNSYRIVNVKRTSVNGSDVVYVLQVRK